jgi:hypothetical protein
MKTVDQVISFTWWLFAVLYTFKIWGLGWGIVSIFVPIFPLIDFAQYLVGKF